MEKRNLSVSGLARRGADALSLLQSAFCRFDPDPLFSYRSAWLVVAVVGRGIAEVQEQAPRVLKRTSMEPAMLAEVRNVQNLVPKGD
jgi:hypothetical protein